MVTKQKTYVRNCTEMSKLIPVTHARGGDWQLHPWPMPQGGGLENWIINGFAWEFMGPGVDIYSVIKALLCVHPWPVAYPGYLCTPIVMEAGRLRKNKKSRKNCLYPGFEASPKTCFHCFPCFSGASVAKCSQSKKFQKNLKTHTIILFPLFSVLRLFVAIRLPPLYFEMDGLESFGQRLSS